LAEGLYYGLEQAGGMLVVPAESAVLNAVAEPPATTRALVRGKCIQKFAPQVESAQWDHITLQSGGGLLKISLLDLFAPDEIWRHGRIIEQARSPEDLRTLKSVS
jgi:proteasome accessory factor A